MLLLQPVLQPGDEGLAAELAGALGGEGVGGRHLAALDRRLDLGDLELRHVERPGRRPRRRLGQRLGRAAAAQVRRRLGRRREVDLVGGGGRVDALVEARERLFDDLEMLLHAAPPSLEYALTPHLISAARASTPRRNARSKASWLG